MLALLSSKSVRVCVSGLMLKFSFIVSSWRRLSIDTRTIQRCAMGDARLFACFLPRGGHYDLDRIHPPDLQQRP